MHAAELQWDVGRSAHQRIFFLRQLMILRVKAIMATMPITMKAVDAIVLTTSSDLFLMKNSLGCRTVRKL